MILIWSSGLARPGTAPWIGLGYAENWNAMLAGPAPPTAPSVSEYLKLCWEEAFRPLLGKKPWPFRVR